MTDMPLPKEAVEAVRIRLREFGLTSFWTDEAQQEIACALIRAALPHLPPMGRFEALPSPPEAEQTMSDLAEALDSFPHGDRHD